MTEGSNPKPPRRNWNRPLAGPQQPNASKHVAVYGMSDKQAYSRRSTARPVTFVCVICQQETTQYRYPGFQPVYCSDACAGTAAEARNERRVEQQREKRRLAREARMQPPDAQRVHPETQSTQPENPLPASQETRAEAGWSPNDREKNPYYTWHLIMDEEWGRIARGYPYSIRVLVHQVHQNVPTNTEWGERGRTATLDQAKTLLHALVAQVKKSEQSRLVGWVIMEYAITGEGIIQERPVYWHPDQERVLTTMREVGPLTSTPRGH
jgi:hypothetical protein